LYIVPPPPPRPEVVSTIRPVEPPTPQKPSLLSFIPTTIKADAYYEEFERTYAALPKAPTGPLRDPIKFNVIHKKMRHMDDLDDTLSVMSYHSGTNYSRWGSSVSTPLPPLQLTDDEDEGEEDDRRSLATQDMVLNDNDQNVVYSTQEIEALRRRQEENIPPRQFIDLESSSVASERNFVEPINLIEEEEEEHGPSTQQIQHSTHLTQQSLYNTHQSIHHTQQQSVHHTQHITKEFITHTQIPSSINDIQELESRKSVHSVRTSAQKSTYSFHETTKNQQINIERTPEYTGDNDVVMREIIPTPEPVIPKRKGKGKEKEVVQPISPPPIIATNENNEAPTTFNNDDWGDDPIDYDYDYDNEQGL
jgi:hypothetical protein